MRERIKEARGWNDACVTKKGKKKLDEQLSALFSKIDADADLFSRLEKVGEILDQKTMERFATERTKFNPVTACSAEYAIARLEAKQGIITREIARRGISPSLANDDSEASQEAATVDDTVQQEDQAADDIFADLLKSL